MQQQQRQEHQQYHDTHPLLSDKLKHIVIDIFKEIVFLFIEFDKPVLSMNTFANG